MRFVQVHASSGRPSFLLPRFPKIKPVGKCVSNGHVIDALHVRSEREQLDIIEDMPVIRAVSVMASRSGRARTKFRTEPMSDTSDQVSLPLRPPASTSNVLCALDSCFPTSDFRPDEDGTIDLTTPENDALYDAARAQLTGRRPSNTGL
jgi:hypothetical protein